MFIQKVVSQLEKYNILYALVGGYAVALHGAVRGTVDIDIVISWSLKNLKLIKKFLNEINLQPQLSLDVEDLFKFKEKYIKEKN